MQLYATPFSQNAKQRYKPQLDSAPLLLAVGLAHFTSLSNATSRSSIPLRFFSLSGWRPIK